MDVNSSTADVLLVDDADGSSIADNLGQDVIIYGQGDVQLVLSSYHLTFQFEVNAICTDE